MDLELGKMLTKEDTKRLLKEDFRKYLYVNFADQKDEFEKWRITQASTICGI